MATKESCGCDHCGIDFTGMMDQKEEVALIETPWKERRSRVRILLGAMVFAGGFLLRQTQVGMVLFIVAYVLLGYEVVLAAIRNLLKGKVFDENFLMTLATAGALIIGEYPEAVAVMLFYSIGEHMQELAVDKSKRSIRALLTIKPDYANLECPGQIKKVSPEIISVNEIIVVKPGERIPLDGTIIEGETTVDYAALTGESLPQEKLKGEQLMAGGINLTGVLRVRVDKVSEESTTTKILKAVESASKGKAKTEDFITKFARYYTPLVVFLAVVIGTVPSLIQHGELTSQWIYRGLIFLVISCPCALVLSIPLAYFGGIGAASRHGILVKGGNFLEALVHADRVIFDKTGTLTKGEFSVTGIYPTVEDGENELLYYGAYGEYYSNHPIGEAIRKSYAKNMEKTIIEDYQEHSGYGTVTWVSGKKVVVGNSRMMTKQLGHFTGNEEEPDGTVVHVAVEGKYLGFMVVEDTIKDSSYGIAKALKANGISEVILLTGDNENTAEKIGTSLEMDVIHHSLLPGDKLSIMKTYLNRQTTTIAVGDGINDAPLLAGADVGFAMGGIGSDAAVEAADVVLMTDDVNQVVKSLEIARRTRSIVWQNIGVALGVKGIVMVLGAFGLASMYQAVFADVGVALIAVLNATRMIKG